MRAPPLGFAPKGLYIGGRWTSSQGDRSFQTINPSTGEKLDDVPAAGVEDVERAVAAAAAACRDWGRTPILERARALERLAQRIVQHAEALALMDAVDSGNAIVGMRGDMTWTADSLRYFAGLVTEIKGETSSRGPGHLNFTRRQPYGVVAKINPFNHPFRFCAEKAAAPLAAGNCVVIKGSEQAPLSSLKLGELCDGIFPPGVVNILTGDGAIGAALVRHPDVRRVGFVGSVPTGRAVARDAAEGLKPVTLELGGKNPIVIFPDADPKKAATAAIRGMNMNRQGQSCSSTSRVLVHRSLRSAVVEELVRQAEALPVGLPWLETSEVGPIVSARQHERVLSYIDTGCTEGATLLTGGGKPPDPALRGGFFVSPTVFDDVTPAMRIAREEIFGPVMSVMTWDDPEEMLARANGVEYGLTAAIVTNDLRAAMETAERIEAGYVWINSTGRYLGAPYGGWKQSGIGQEECVDERRPGLGRALRSQRAAPRQAGLRGPPEALPRRALPEGPARGGGLPLLQGADRPRRLREDAVEHDAGRGAPLLPHRGEGVHVPRRLLVHRARVRAAGQGRAAEGLRARHVEQPADEGRQGSRLFQILIQYKLFNSLTGLGLVYTVTELPLTIYLLRAFFAQIPTELEEAARIDGCSDWAMFWRVMFPMALPAVATTVILNFIYFWNEFLYAVVFITQQKIRTLPLAIQFLVSDQYQDIGMLATGLMIATLPVLVLYLFLSEWFVKGMTAGAIKG